MGKRREYLRRHEVKAEALQSIRMMPRDWEHSLRISQDPRVVWFRSARSGRMSSEALSTKD